VQGRRPWRAVAGAVGAASALGGLAAATLLRGVTQPRSFPFVLTPASHGLEFEEVEFHSRGDGKRIGAWFIPASVEREQGAVRHSVIVIQGWNRHRADEELKAIEIYAGLARRGFDVLAIDLRGRGTSEAARNQFGDTEYRDVLGAYDWLKTRDADDVRFAVGALGFSMGAAVAILAAANEPGIAGVVADSPYADVRELIRREARRLRVPHAVTNGVLHFAGRAGLPIGAYRPIDVVERIAPRPLLLIHGEQDFFVPTDHTHRLAMRANGSAELWLIPEAGHVGGYYCRGDEYLDRVTAVLRRASALPGVVGLSPAAC
jgi:pimeloyl-ACP methyl ester carboxylesterase